MVAYQPHIAIYGFSLFPDVAIDALSRSKGTTSMTPAKAAFTSAGVLLTTIRVSFLPVHVGRLLADVYRTQ